jgi:hypothetical protein
LFGAALILELVTIRDNDSNATMPTTTRDTATPFKESRPTNIARIPCYIRSYDTYVYIVRANGAFTFLVIQRFSSSYSLPALSTASTQTVVRSIFTSPSICAALKLRALSSRCFLRRR